MASRNGNKRRGKDRTPRLRVDRGTLQTRLHHARAFLGASDRERLEILVNVPAERLHAEGAIKVSWAKAKPMTDTEFWEEVRKAVGEERERLFAKAANAPHMAQRRDPIGRAWYEGLLDGYGADAAVLRELGREYGGLYWGELRTLNATIAGYDERVGRPNIRRKFYAAGLSGAEAARYDKFESILEPLGHQVRGCLQKLCVDDCLWADGPAWLDRCINSHRKARRDRGEQCAPPRGELARGYDVDVLDKAITGLQALAIGATR